MQQLLCSLFVVCCLLLLMLLFLSSRPVRKFSAYPSHHFEGKKGIIFSAGCGVQRNIPFCVVLLCTAVLVVYTTKNAVCMLCPKQCLRVLRVTTRSQVRRVYSLSVLKTGNVGVRAEYSSATHSSGLIVVTRDQQVRTYVHSTCTWYDC